MLNKKEFAIVGMCCAQWFRGLQIRFPARPHNRRGDFYGHFPNPQIQEGQLSVTGESISTRYNLTAKRIKPVKENCDWVNWPAQHDINWH